MPTCDDLRIGGTLSATGITGGTSVNNYGISVEDWSHSVAGPARPLADSAPSLIPASATPPCAAR